MEYMRKFDTHTPGGIISPQMHGVQHINRSCDLEKRHIGGTVVGKGRNRPQTGELYIKIP